MNYRKPVFWIIMISVVALIIGAVCSLTNPISRLGDSDTDLYIETIRNLGENELFAVIETGAPLPVLLVTSEDCVYDDNSGNRVTTWCDVYYPVDGMIKQIGQITSSGTAYPIAYDKTGIYGAGGHGMQRYEIDWQNGETKVAEGIYEEFDEAGSASYFMDVNDDVRAITEEEYVTAWGRYKEASAVSFPED